MSRVRYSVGGLGFLLGLYGAYVLLSRQDLGQLVSLGLWLAGGLVVHDAILAPVVLALAWTYRSVPVVMRRAASVALVVVGGLSVLAVPVIGRFGARPDNPTLLDRPYFWSWVVLVVLSVVVVLLVGRFSQRDGSPGSPGSPGSLGSLAADGGGADGEGAGR